MPRSDAHFTRNKTVRERLSNLRTSINTLPTTQDVLRAECQRLELPLVVEEVAESSGANVLWVGEKSSENVLFYIHGQFPIAGADSNISANIFNSQQEDAMVYRQCLVTSHSIMRPNRRWRWLASLTPLLCSSIVGDFSHNQLSRL